MSLNVYDKNTGELVTLANGQRIFVCTKAAHDAAVAAGTIPNNCLVAITDDGDISGVVNEAQNGNMNPITSNAVYQLQAKSGTGDPSYRPYIAHRSLYRDDGLQNHTGFIQIKFPFGKRHKMTRFIMDLYQYTGSIATYQISFYPYVRGDGTWYMAQSAAVCNGSIMSTPTVTDIANLPVSFGFDNSDYDHVCVWIGKTDGTTMFTYSEVVLRDGIVGFNDFNASAAFDGVEISFISSITGVISGTADSTPKTTS